MFRLLLYVNLLFTSVTVTDLYAADTPDLIKRTTKIENGQIYILNSDFGGNVDLIEWKVDDKILPNIWDGWRYGLDVPQYLTAASGNSYYGFGVWKPEKSQYNEFTDISTQDWLLDHGINVSFGTDSIDGGIRYRLDVRWHEKTNTEFLFQLQMPLQ